MSVCLVNEGRNSANEIEMKDEGCYLSRDEDIVNTVPLITVVIFMTLISLSMLLSSSTHSSISYPFLPYPFSLSFSFFSSPFFFFFLSSFSFFLLTGE